MSAHGCLTAWQAGGADTKLKPIPTLLLHGCNYANQWSYAPPTFPITSSCSTFIVIEVVLCHINFNFP